MKRMKIATSTFAVLLLSLAFSCKNEPKHIKQIDNGKTIGDVYDSTQLSLSKSRVACEDTFDMIPRVEHKFDCADHTVLLGDFQFKNGLWSIQVLNRLGNYELHDEGDSLIFFKDECDYLTVHIMSIRREKNRVGVKVKSKCK